MDWLLGPGYESMCCGADGVQGRQKRVVVTPRAEAASFSKGETFMEENGISSSPHSKSYTVVPATMRGRAVHEFSSMPTPLKLESLPISAMAAQQDPPRTGGVHPDILALTRSHVLNSVSETHVRNFRELMRHRHVAVGEVLAKIDDLGDSFFLVLSGEFSVSADGVESVHLQNGDFYGESAFCALVVWGWERQRGNQPGVPEYAFRKSSCTATKPSEVLEISARMLLDKQLHPSIADNIASIAANLERRWGG